ncbi:MAG: hypothetical protein QOG44_2001 [Acidimicrobiaceae bacterium]|jgi:hypothetical protein|nr:hypothetical protein [Acidimicrobiaceae bacterium]
MNVHQSALTVRAWAGTHPSAMTMFYASSARTAD